MGTGVMIGAGIFALTGQEAELAREYFTIEALKAHPRLEKFIRWVAKRPPGFHSKTPGGRRKR